MSINNISIKEVLEVFGMTTQTFSNFTGIPKKTIDGWKLKGVSSLGEITLANILKVKKLEEKFLSEQDKLIEKSKDFDAILAIFEKYSN